MSDHPVSSPHFEFFIDQLRKTFSELEEIVSGHSPIHGIELALRRFGESTRRAALEVMAEMLRERDARLGPPRCPVCGSPMTRNRAEPLTLQFEEGESVLSRIYWECRDDKVYRYALDDDLGLLAVGECTPQFGHDVCQLMAEVPASTSVRILRTLTGRRISESLVKQQVERDGTALAALERREAEALWPFDSSGRRRLREIICEGLPALHDPPPPKGTVILEMDEVMANLGNDRAVRQEIADYEDLQKVLKAEGKECRSSAPTTWRGTRVARIFRKQDLVEKIAKSGKPRGTITRSETLAVVNDPMFFQMRVNALCHVWRANEYAERVMIADGAEYLWDLAKTVFDPTVEILDVRHAESHIHECGRALFGDKTPEARQWARRWCRCLKKHGAGGLAAELDELASRTWSDAAGRTLANLIEYVQTHLKRMDYPSFRRKGLPIGSGAIESANRQVVVDRCKRAGTRWKREGLQWILSFRCAQLSGNWERVCASIRKYRRLTESPVIAPVLAQPVHVVTEATAVAAATKPKSNVRRGPSKVARGTTAVTAPAQRKRTTLIPERKMAQLIASGLIKCCGDEHRLASRTVIP